MILDGVDCVLGHGSIGGPFAAHNADQSGKGIYFADIVT
jgi:hypothetical protein